VSHIEPWTRCTRGNRADWKLRSCLTGNGLRAPRTMTILLLDLPPPWR